MTMEALLRLIGRKDKIKLELREAVKERRALDKKIEKLEEYAELIDTVGEVFEGVPIEVRVSDTTCGRRGRQIYGAILDCRTAEVYLNAHNRQTWGVRLRAEGKGLDFQYGGKYLGNQFGETEAIRLAKNWAAHGTCDLLRDLQYTH